MRIALAAILCALAVLPASAHEVRPGYLAINETATDEYRVQWKVPARGQMRLAIYPVLPENCSVTSEPVTRNIAASYVDTWEVRCPGGLTGGTIFIDGLSSLLTDTLVRITMLDESTRVARLSPSSPAFQVPEAPTLLQVAATYVGLGVEHILLGIDHLLFVLALLLLVRGVRQVIVTITAFTLSHSLTLAAATLGWVNVPQQPVEAVIALSILLIATEIIQRDRGHASLTQQWPWAVAFMFGLLHGFGFAGALSEIGLPEQAIPSALLFFNIGVELGQLLFIAVVLVSWRLIRGFAKNLPKPLLQLPAYAIGTMAAFWSIERIAGF